ncbi:methyltransferase domain-containing protein [Lachnospiraceae bacterium 62-26]|jgi:SAM-dependent methyltransferase
MYVNNDIDYMRWLLNKNLFIFGGGDLGIRICKKLKRLGYNVVGFVDNSNLKIGKNIENLPVYSLEEAENILLQSKVYLVLNNKYEGEIKKQLMENSKNPFVCVKDIDFSYNNVSYYDEEYFEYQKKIGENASAVDLVNFIDFIDKNDTVVEFGSGGGFLLSLIDAKQKVGIEINPYAIECSKRNGVKTVDDAAKLPDQFADIIISTHALEHVDTPLEVLVTLWNKLKDNGKIIFIVPFQSEKYEYRKDDIDNEFWNWNCRTLGNLFKRAGYFVQRVEVICNQYPPQFADIIGQTGMDTLLCIDELYSKYSESMSIRIIASKSI